MKLHMSKKTMNDDMLDYFTNHELPKPSSLKVEQMLKKKNRKKVSVKAKAAPTSDADYEASDESDGTDGIS